jgi:hypothetical protein
MLKSSWKTIIKKLKRNMEVVLECALRLVYKKGVWRKVRGWLERWERNEWREWKKNKGVVYAWVLVRDGRCYVGSTKGTLEERARSHLGKVRKVREVWRKKEKIEDEEVTVIHREIARRPEEWVMIPISGKVMNWKRVEKRAIRYFGGDLNTKERKKKKKENKRNRIFKREKRKEKKKKKEK